MSFLIKSLRIFALVLSAVSSLFFSATVLADTCEPYDANAEYKLVFADEFEGTELDRGRWNTEFLWGPGVIINNELQYYVSDDQFGYNPFTVSDGVLSITADKAPFDRTRLYLTKSIYSATSAEVLWRQPEGAVLYTVERDGAYLGDVKGGAWFEPVLRDSIDYAYQITALDENGNEVASEQITVNTSERATFTPRKPFSLELATKIYSQNSAELQWRPPNRATYFLISHNGNTERFNGQSYSSLYLSSVEANADLTYSVAAYDVCDELIIEETVVLNTADGPTPNTVSDRLVIDASVYSESSAEISWNTVSGATQYELYDNGSLIDTIFGRSLFIEDMVPGEDRKFLVIAQDEFGVEIDSTTRTLNTADASFALNRQPYVSGVITSYDAFRFRYGKVEMRARMPKGKGYWSAFWLLNAYYHDAEPEDPEIDIIEAIGDTTTTANHAYHTKSDTNGDSVTDATISDEFRASIPDFSENFNRYSVEWTPEEIVWYVNDTQTGRVSGERVSKEQMYILLNLAVGGTFPGSPNNLTQFPGTFEVDYVRVFQKTNQ